MNHVSDVSFEDITDSPYMKAVYAHFEQDGRARSAQLTLRHSSVAVLLFHVERQQFLMVRQFRPAVFVGRVWKMAENAGKRLEEVEWDKYDAELGYTLELCAGLVDKPLSLAEIAVEEMEEECGYTIPHQQLRLVSRQLTGSSQHVFYAELTESMRVGDGGGNSHDGECIEKVWMGVEETRARLTSDQWLPPGLHHAYAWWFSTIHAQPTPHSSQAWLPASFPSSIAVFGNDWQFEKGVREAVYRPVRMTFTLEGQERKWDMAVLPDSVGVVAVDRTRKELVLCQRCRASDFVGRVAMQQPENKGKKLTEIDFSQYPVEWAYTLEPFSGQMSGSAEESVERVARDKLGVPVHNTTLIQSYIWGLSLTGDRQLLYGVEVDSVDDSLLANDLEYTLFRVPLAQTGSLIEWMLSQEGRLIGPPALMLALRWAHHNY